MEQNHCINIFEEAMTCVSLTLHDVNAYLDPYRSRVNEMSLTESLLSSTIILAIFFSIYRFPSFGPRAHVEWTLDRFAKRRDSSDLLPRVRIYPSPRREHSEYTYRTSFTDRGTFLFAWPSRGGVIVLDADAVDMEFLDLDPLNPPLERLPNQSDEDEFCNRLLLAGGKWWDSVARYQLVCRAEEEITIEEFDDGTEPLPTLKERRFVSVGWPSDGRGLWVAQFEKMIYGEVEEEENLVPEDIGRLRLARTMDERCGVLRERFQGRFYEDAREYEGFAEVFEWEGELKRGKGLPK